MPSRDPNEKHTGDMCVPLHCGVYICTDTSVLSREGREVRTWEESCGGRVYAQVTCGCDTAVMCVTLLCLSRV